MTFREPSRGAESADTAAPSPPSGTAATVECSEHHSATLAANAPDLLQNGVSETLWTLLKSAVPLARSLRFLWRMRRRHRRAPVVFPLSRTIVSDYNNRAFWSYSCPTIFPYGIGTPDDERSGWISDRAQIDHILRMGGPEMNDVLFQALCFDRNQRHDTNREPKRFSANADLF